MSWMQKLYETYELCAGNRHIYDSDDLCPAGYSIQGAHINVVINEGGNFRRASFVPKESSKTLIPVTEKSLTGRTSGIAPHPLCDSLQYCAADYKEFNGVRESFYDRCDFTQKEFEQDGIGKPLDLINQVLTDSGKPLKMKLKKDRTIRWLNLAMALINMRADTVLSVRKHSNRMLLGKTYPALCPLNVTSYLMQLERWAISKHSHPKVRAIYQYVVKGCLVKDLVYQNLLAVEDKALCVEQKDETSKDESHPIMKLLNYDDKGVKDQAKVFIRWSVEGVDLCSNTWEDKTLFEAWGKYLESYESNHGFCYVTGAKSSLAQKHPAKLRNARDGAKLISSNDMSGFTFLGRFTQSEQVAGISAEVSQKAHSALRWLIGRKQAFLSGNMVYVSWAVKGVDIPDPWSNSLDFLGDQEELGGIVANAGQAFAFRLRKKIAGYKAFIEDTDDIVVMGLDSATKGRMSIIFYRQLCGSEFLKRIERWHDTFSWAQNYGKDSKFLGAPSPKEIAWAAYCTKIGEKKIAEVDEKLRNATIERLLPCIVDGRNVPKDLVVSAVRRVSNRYGLDRWEWEKCLGIACSLYKGANRERSYKMALEEERVNRDYLYGRLLAVAEQIESMAMFFAKEKARETSAARYMQRFSDRPFSTWKTIENALVPYKARIQSKAPGLLEGYMEILGQIHWLFIVDDYAKDDRLSGEYLLGYHCQRKWLREHKRSKGQWILKETDEHVPEQFEEDNNETQGETI